MRREVREGLLTTHSPDSLLCVPAKLVRIGQRLVIRETSKNSRVQGSVSMVLVLNGVSRDGLANDREVPVTQLSACSPSIGRKGAKKQWMPATYISSVSARQ
jgi:hypothetical protein